MEPETSRLVAQIDGHVQGVGFRAATQREAEKFSLTGWVGNNPDGSVTVVAEGPRPALEQLLAWLQFGPTAARVESVKHHFSSANREFRRFTVRLL